MYSGIPVKKLNSIIDNNELNVRCKRIEKTIKSERPSLSIEQVKEKYEAELMAIDGVKEKYEAELMAIDGVVGVGIGECDDKFCIKVFGSYFQYRDVIIKFKNFWRYHEFENKSLNPTFALLF